MNLQKDVVQRILDYDYISGLKEPSVAAIFYIGSVKKINVFWGKNEISIPVFNNINDIIKANLNITIALNYYSFRSSYDTTLEIMKIPSIKSISIIAEGIPVRQSKMIKYIGEQKNITILGPSTVGAIFPERRRFGNAMGSIEHIENIHLYHKGSIGLITKSGGLLNEMANLINLHSEGIHSAISVGGDRYPCTTMLDILKLYQDIDEIKMIVILGEVGGTQELEIGLYNKLHNKKPIIAWCSGTSLDIIKEKTDIKFGHAGSYIEKHFESANFKNNFLRENNVIVPEFFEDFESLFIENIHKLNLNKKENVVPVNKLPYDFNDLYKNNRIRINSSFISTISNERGELTYNNRSINDFINMDNKIGATIGALLFKKNLPNYLCEFLDLCVVLLADHGIAVSSSHNTAVAARAGQNISAAVASGLLTIHERHGGALQDCAKIFFDAKYLNCMNPDIFVKHMKKIGKIIPGIGHAYKNSTTNKDYRLVILYDFIVKNFPNYDLVIYAKDVEKITLQKKDNLILNVDGSVTVLLREDVDLAQIISALQ